MISRFSILGIISLLGGMGLFSPLEAKAQNIFATALGNQENSLYPSSPFSLEVRASYFRPSIDQEPALTGTPFRDTFGDDYWWLVGGEFGWQGLRLSSFGSLGPALGIGYRSFSTKAPIAENTSKLSGDDTSLYLIPTYLVAVLRMDVLSVLWKIPLVPYLKGGLAGTFWLSSDEKGISVEETDRGTKKAIGYTLGFQWAAGLALNLDFLDPAPKDDGSLSYRPQKTYLFGEYTQSYLGLLPNSLFLGSKMFTVGLNLEF